MGIDPEQAGCTMRAFNAAMGYGQRHFNVLFHSRIKRYELCGAGRCCRSVIRRWRGTHAWHHAECGRNF
jgi:hypothetical protein